eukprot:366405-Chlamydomonas_euryale.AAC.9
MDTSWLPLFSDTREYAQAVEANDYIKHVTDFEKCLLLCDRYQTAFDYMLDFEFSEVRQNVFEFTIPMNKTDVLKSVRIHWDTKDDAQQEIMLVAINKQETVMGVYNKHVAIPVAGIPVCAIIYDRLVLRFIGSSSDIPRGTMTIRILPIHGGIRKMTIVSPHVVKNGSITTYIKNGSVFATP